VDVPPQVFQNQVVVISPLSTDPLIKGGGGIFKTGGYKGGEKKESKDCM
jgi:hypothetical protein